MKLQIFILISMLTPLFTSGCAPRISQNHVVSTYKAPVKPSAQEIARFLKKSTVKISGQFIEEDIIFNDEKAWHGTGIIIGKKQNEYIVITNLHVIGFNDIYDSEIGIPNISKYQLMVNFHDNHQGKINKVYVNSSLKDIAIIFVSTKRNYPAAKISKSALTIGQQVFAMGHPIGLDFSFSSGVISGFRKFKTDAGELYNFIQTDAAINSGNSGGALVNDYGEVIGINTLKISKKGISGIGFAITSKEIMNSIESNEFFEFPQEPRLIGNFVKKLKAVSLKKK